MSLLELPAECRVDGRPATHWIRSHHPVNWGVIDYLCEPHVQPYIAGRRGYDWGVIGEDEP